MCMIDEMREQAKKDMAAYRLVWGEGYDMLYTREMAETNLRHIIDKLPIGEFTTREFAVATGMKTKSTPAVLGRLQRAGVIERCGEYRQFDGNRSYRRAPIWMKTPCPNPPSKPPASAATKPPTVRGGEGGE